MVGPVPASTAFLTTLILVPLSTAVGRVLLPMRKKLIAATGMRLSLCQFARLRTSAALAVFSLRQHFCAHSIVGLTWTVAEPLLGRHWWDDQADVEIIVRACGRRCES